MRVKNWILASLVFGVFVVLLGGCKPKLGAKCTPGSSFCTPDGILFCGDENKLVSGGCHGPNGCVQHGKTASCDQSISQVGEGCLDNENVACTVDTKGELDCKNHKWVLGATCKGAKGCELKGDELFCDHTIADKDDPCHRDGQIACTTDKTLIMRCQNNIMTAIDTCRGPKSCTFEEQPARQIIEFNCDDSIAAEGDPCASENNHACSVDGKGMHICKGGKFVAFKACAGAKGCRPDANSDKLLCDTGSGFFSGAGGGGKLSNASGAAGGTKAKTAGAASASAKPAASASASATVAASASAKPAASASAAVAGSASAKPGASAAPSASVAAAGSAKVPPGLAGSAKLGGTRRK